MRPALVIVFGVAACSSGLRVPPTGPQPATATPIVVDYPPPPAQLEKIDRDPGRPCVWVDGTHVWLGRHWEWTAGQWVVPQPTCYYRAPVLVWAPSVNGPSTLYYFPAKWYEERSSGSVECKAPEPCPQATAQGD